MTAQLGGHLAGCDGRSGWGSLGLNVGALGLPRIGPSALFSDPEPAQCRGHPYDRLSLAVWSPTGVLK